ncbi:MAG: stage III sporulation protein AF [Thermoflavifilum sp.]|nr:stage III sporulation protein AF [Thermoflavifilum sp.]MCL6514007.1 stage III sporulation protein AF [Alicyclobacillus sp.]
MTALGHWLKELVVLVLLAGLTDLVLPSASLQRYVRTVLGLAIIAMILQPILPLFDAAWAQKAAVTASQELESSDDGSVNATDSALTSSLAAVQNEQTDDLVADAIRRMVTEQFGLNVTAVQVTGAATGDVRVSLTVQGGHDEVEQLQRAIAQTLGVDPSRVQIHAS